MCGVVRSAEPLLHPDLPEMVALAHARGARTELVTNGLLLDRPLARALVRAGLDQLVVSVDGATPEAHADVRSGADLGLVVENVAGLHAEREAHSRRDPPNPELGLAFVAMRRNVHELPGLRRLARELGASFVVVTNVLPYTAELRDETLYGLWAGRELTTDRSPDSPTILLPRLDARRDVLESVAGLLAHGGAADLLTGQAGPPDAPGHCRFVAEGAAAVAWDGELSPCVALLHSYSCYVLGRPKRIRRYTLGNVAQEDVARLWARPEYAAFRRRVREFDFAPCTNCGSCNLAETNETDCFGNPFPVCGDCLWAKGVIQCP